jgi:coenzyme F420-0:L-glutamate ligase / coenzyme F420-1:gamma-L-glutamate ligase
VPADQRLSFRPLLGLPEVRPGDDAGALLAASARAHGLAPGEAVIVAQKIVSKAEGRVVELARVNAGPAAIELAARTGKRPELCELILSESRRIVRQRGGTVICETRQGFVCANAGIDSSNTPAGTVILLPEDADRSARTIQAALSAAAGGRVGVVVIDTHGRAFRRGLVNVAIGVAGFSAVIDHRGAADRHGRVLSATEEALADELAAAAGVLMGKDSGVPAVIASGVSLPAAPGTVQDLLRDPAYDLFRDEP